jgi:predicted TIM-barrel fold metal-dependent hydrolase
MMLRDVPHINEPVYDPLWATCQELNVPVCFHSGVTREIEFPPYVGFSPEITSTMEAITRPASAVLVMANFLFARILERFPKLQVIFAETSLAWGAYELELADHQFERQAPAHRGLRFAAVAALQAAVPHHRVVRYDGVEDPRAHRRQQAPLEHELSAEHVHLAGKPPGDRARLRRRAR